jgi:predicted nucleic acid-binding protein
MTADAVAVDASVAVKWVITVEEFSGQALALLRDCTIARRPILVPPHFSGEVANAIYQRVRSTDPAKHLERDEAEVALTEFLNISVVVRAPVDLLPRAFAFAADHRLPGVYDSLYVTLAQVLDVELWTADRRLLDALGTAAPWVHFIRDYS